MKYKLPSTLGVKKSKKSKFAMFAGKSMMMMSDAMKMAKKKKRMKKRRKGKTRKRGI